MHRFFRWRERLLTTKDEKEVRMLLADYLLSVDPVVLRQMPQPCKEALGSDNVQECAVALLHAEMAYQGSEEMRQLLHEVAHTFAAASVRLSKFKVEPIVPGA